MGLGYETEHPFDDEPDAKSMTSPAIKLAKECGLPAADIESLQEHQPEFLASFYTKAQAQALRNAAEWFGEEYGYELVSHTDVDLRRMAEELERGT